MSASGDKRPSDGGGAPSGKRPKGEVLNEGRVQYTKKRILVTGGAGFVGSHLCDSLLEDEGNHVICLDNFYSGSLDNVAHLRDHPRFELVRHDVVDPIRLEVDQIFHLACPASPVFYQKNGITTLKTSFLGSLNMLGLAKRTGARILFASTSEVYGDPDVHPQVETYWGNVNPIGIRSCYDVGKRAAETLAFDYMRMHGVQIRVARIFNTYGPRMAFADGRVVSNFINQALSGKALTLYGDGAQTRSFCYVSDLVAGLRALMEGEHTGPINLGNPGEFTIKELAELVQKEINPDAEFVRLPLPSDDPKRRRPDITRAKTLLKWEPKVPLADGLKRTIADFKSRVGK